MGGKLLNRPGSIPDNGPVDNSEAISALARQFTRRASRHEARIEPHRDHADQFHLSLPDSQAGLAVIDVSKGGLGLKSGIFMPRQLRLILHISGVQAGSEADIRDLVINAIVRRCSMIDHKPTYRVGLQFLDPGGSDEQMLIRSSAAAEASEEKEPVSAGEARGH